MARRWCITGVGSGFGEQLAHLVLAAGEELIACDRDAAGVAAYVGHPRVTTLVFDLLDDEQTQGAADTLATLAPDVLVLNGGYAYFASMVQGTPEAFEAMFRVNVSSAQRLLRATLPGLRASGGTAVFLSSVAGRMVFPESGFYAATKHAVEALAEATYIESCRSGLSVVVVEPGSFNTGFLARAQAESPPRPTQGDEAAWHALWDEAKFGVLRPPQPALWVAEAILDAVNDAARFVRVPVGVDGQAHMALRDTLGADAWVQLMAERNGGPKVPWLPSAADVLRADDDALLHGDAFRALRRVGAAGFLEHWRRDPEAADAFERLSSLGLARVLQGPAA